MAAIDLSNFNFCGDQITDINSILWDETIDLPDVTDFVNVYPDIVVEGQIGFWGEGHLVGVKNQGCKPTPQDYNLGSRAVDWEPKPWEILLGLCYTDLQGTAAEYKQHKSERRPQLQDTDYMAIFLRAVRRDVQEFALRTTFFMSETVSEVGSGSGDQNLTPGLGTQYFDILNSLWQQVITKYNGTAYHIPITENAGASYAAQAINPANVQQYFRDAINASSPLLQGSPNARFYVTRSIFNAYKATLQQPTAIQIPQVYNNLVDGMNRDVLYFDGYPVIAVDYWDVAIKKYFNDGTKWDMPNRFLFTTKQTYGLGVDAFASFSISQVWYEKKDRMVYYEMMGKSDVKMVAPDGWLVAGF